MKQGSSSLRVNEEAREVIANILLFEMTDPRLAHVTITGCEVSFDRSVCNVYYTTDPDRYAEVAEALTKAAGRIRSLMAKKLSWRVAPELRFIQDGSVDQAERISHALRAEAERSARKTQSNPEACAERDASAAAGPHASAGAECASADE